MIKSDGEYGKLRLELSKSMALKHRLAALLRDLEWHDRELLNLLDNRISLLSAQLSQYQKRHADSVDVGVLVSVKDLPSALIRARLWLGWTQKELSERTELPQFRISRYEMGDYAAAKLGAAIHIAGVIAQELQRKAK